MSTHALAKGAMQRLKLASMTCASRVILTVDLEAVLPISWGCIHHWKHCQSAVVLYDGAYAGETQHAKQTGNICQ